MDQNKVMELIIERAILLTAMGDYLKHNGVVENVDWINSRSVGELRKIQKTLIAEGINLRGVELLDYYLRNNDKTAWLSSTIKANYIKLVNGMISELKEYINDGEWYDVEY